MTGTGFTYDPVTGAPTAGAITSVQFFSAGNFELASFGDVSNAPLATFHTRWFSDDPNGVFNILLPSADTLIGSEGDDAFAPGLGSDVVDGGAGGDDEVAYRGGPNRPTGVTVDLNFGDPDDDLGAAWSGGTLIPDGDEFDTLISIENVLVRT